MASTGPPLIGDGEEKALRKSGVNNSASTGPPLIGDGEDGVSLLFVPGGMDPLQRVRR